MTALHPRACIRSITCAAKALALVLSMPPDGSRTSTPATSVSTMSILLLRRGHLYRQRELISPVASIIEDTVHEALHEQDTEFARPSFVDRSGIVRPLELEGIEGAAVIFHDGRQPAAIVDELDFNQSMLRGVVGILDDVAQHLVQGEIHQVRRRRRDRVLGAECLDRGGNGLKAARRCRYPESVSMHHCEHLRHRPPSAAPGGGDRRAVYRL